MIKLWRKNQKLISKHIINNNDWWINENDQNDYNYLYSERNDKNIYTKMK